MGRGLHFLCYQTSIVDQFEFLQSNWANTDVNPKPLGHDLIIGEVKDGPRHFQLLTPEGGAQLVEVEREFVVATGGGYFFAPSISAIRDVLASH